MKKEIVTEKDLFTVLDLLDLIGMDYWLDGGWGVDVLTGKQNREHRDIDIDFDADFQKELVQKLINIGYEIVVDWMPCRMELWHKDYGYLDIHPLILELDGSAKQADLEGGFYNFDADYFTKVAYKNRYINCISQKAQKLFHSGYELREVDHIDLGNLELLEKEGGTNMDIVKEISAKIVSSLAAVSGIKGIVLGGSRARGTHTHDSDIDIGIYYDNDTLDIIELNNAAQAVDDEHRANIISPPGGWGQWVNGGGWLIIDGYHVDFILRDMVRVKKEIEECSNGNVTAHYQTGHPHAYINAMYMGEAAIGKILWEKGGSVSALKQATGKYPDELKNSLIDFFSFEAGFSLMFAENSINKDDTYYTAAHIVRSVSALNQVLFAVNQEYCLNEKKAVKMIDGFAVKPSDYKNRIDAIFASIGVDNQNACMLLRNLIDEVSILSKNIS